MNIKFKTKIKYVIMFFCLLFLFLTSSCRYNNQNTDYTISFDMPTKDNLPMPLGRSFYVTGNINSKHNIPLDATFELNMLNQNNEIIRHVYDLKPNSDNYYIYPNMINKFTDDFDKIYDIIRSTNQCEYLVLDSSRPDESFKNAEIKCSLLDKKFKALIVGATDEKHGAAVNDGCNFTDSNDNPYYSFSPGKYTLEAMLKNKNGDIISKAKKSIMIGNPKNSLIMRFHPKEYLNLILNKINKIVNDAKTNIDYIPGYMYGINNNAGGRTMLFKSNDMALYQNTHTYYQVYMIDPESTTWTVETPYLYYINHIDNPDFFTACHFDIGEPILTVDNKKIEGNIICFQNKDYHDICRIDEIEIDSKENIFDIKKSLNTTHTNVKNKNIIISPNQNFAIMGVLAPTKLDDCYIFDQYNDNLKITNRIESLSYTFTCNDSNIKYNKPVYLKRENVEKTNDYYDSVLEYYHVFNSAEFKANKTYQACVIGLDKNGKEIEGTEEQFSIIISSK